MRKTKNLFDNLLWYSLYLLPIALTLLSWFKGQFLPLSDIMANSGLSIVTNNIVYENLITLFGSASSVFPVFASNGMLEYLTYFVMLMIIHIFVDVLLFIPRFCHKLLDKGVSVNG